MSKFATDYLSSRLPIKGLAAYSIHAASRLLDIQCLSKSLYLASTEVMLDRLVLGSRALLPSAEASVQFCWIFEAHRVYVAGRPDGLFLALLVENNPSAQLVRIKEALQGFLELAEP